MGHIEVRRVPANWEHPKDDKGHYIPLLGKFAQKLADWEEGAAKWAEGLIAEIDISEYSKPAKDRVRKWVPAPKECAGTSFEECNGEKPQQEWYMPSWPEAERTHYQMYETTSEGTPISRVCETPEELATWLTNNSASIFGHATASYQNWLSVIQGADTLLLEKPDGSVQFTP